MSIPQRITMSRRHPWSAEHPDAIIVDRRTKWGNPWRVKRVKGGYIVTSGDATDDKLVRDSDCGYPNLESSRTVAQRIAVQNYEFAFRGWSNCQILWIGG